MHERGWIEFHQRRHRARRRTRRRSRHERKRRHGRRRLWRNDCRRGPVSVTLTPIAGTATAGSDFIADPVTLTWADGESGSKSAAFAIVDDTEEEPSESFTIELSNPTGGAVLGVRSTTVVSIARSDQPPPAPKPKSKGGGATGLLSLLLLGVMSLLRSARMRRRKNR
jgi:hypothetical protein